MPAVAYSNNDLSRFFLQLMGDNALILYNAFSPQEKDLPIKLKELAAKFDGLATRAQNPSVGQMAQINKEAYQATLELRTNLLELLKQILTTRYHIDIKPMMINYFIDEAEKYMELLNGFMTQKTPMFDLLSEEIFWLPVFSIQNRYIADNLGYFQEQTRTYAQHLAQYLTNYAAFSDELKGLTRIGTDTFPMLKQHHVATMELLNTYNKFLNNITGLVAQQKLQGSMSLLYLDRAQRMLCFFLKNASAALEIKVLECDPYSKRLSRY
jgi:hypothetical protein